MTARFRAWLTPARTGALLLLVTVAVFALVFAKTSLVTTLRPGSVLVVDAARDYKLEADKSEVKIAGTPVGTVASVEQTAPGHVEIRLKLDPGTVEKLGTAPRADIRPTTVLGGTYYVDLVAGGRPGRPDGGRIPADRTTTPVELDTALAAIPPDAQRSLQRTFGLLDRTLRPGPGGAQDPLRSLLRTAPATLVPAGQTLDALRGRRPDTDLEALVTNVDRAAGVLSERDGQLGSVVDSFATTADVLARESRPVSDAVAAMPETLRAVHRGADDLSTTLDRIPPTADAIDPAVRDLDPLFRDLDPALARTHDLLDQLRPALDDAHPLVGDLVPAVRAGNRVLDDVADPVFDRINGPILGALNAEFHGTPEGDENSKYPGGGLDTRGPLYAQLGYALTNLNGAIKTYDGNAGMINFQPGFGASSLITGQGGLDGLLDRLNHPLTAPGLTDAVSPVARPLLDPGPGR
ncbi:MlaD family protein [Actinomycetospora sp. TBRC 11914]|uniref:MlaD family protein n=1 Tax=Actinomycetospora sp. TBRC 11914 TaxID=2729387 RepID=UPI00145D664C|nr:MlaD family protein [Actinomycetospora sp. TBRC 11914]NMO91480.1 MCE family protein [Actinomycetospora sp. TBRC 11914]